MNDKLLWPNHCHAFGINPVLLGRLPTYQQYLAGVKQTKTVVARFGVKNKYR